MSAEKMLVFGYVRVSTENQLENYSIEEQTSRIESYCAAKGWTLLRTYTDGGYSGGNTDRPALKKMLKEIRTSKIDAVVVYKLDRLSRSQKDTLTLIEDEFLSHNTDFVSINENFDTSSPFGRAMIGILSVFAQLEKDQITERFTMGRIGRGKAGYFHGGGNAPTGYRYVDGNLEVDEYEALQVREAFQLFLDGKSINAIERSLSNRYTTKWSATKVRNVLKNSIYIGKVKFLGKEYSGAHPPLVDEGTYNTVNRILEGSGREDAKTTAQKNPFRAGYMLSGLVYCGNCGARYSANHGYYRCYSRAKSSKKFIVDPNCKNENWEIEKLDHLVQQQLDNLMSNESLLNSVLSRSQGKKVISDKKKLAQSCGEIDRQIEKLIELYQVSSIPMETVTKKIHELSDKKKTLQAKLGAPDEVESTELFVSALENFKTGFQDGDTDKQRCLLSALIERIVIDGENVEVKWRL